jgi:hypothetical protein
MCQAQCYNRLIYIDVPYFFLLNKKQVIRYALPAFTIDFVKTYLLSQFSHCWLATPHDVLQADWQDVWHSPQPPFFTEAVRSLVSIVLILSIVISPI